MNGIDFNGTIFVLTLILLTWRILRVPNNASKWQMGFNSEFKGLNPAITSKLSVAPDKGTKNIYSMLNCFFGLSV
jgi:hypothetical protein